MKPKIGFVGIGTMGGDMVTNLRRNGFDVIFPHARLPVDGRALYGWKW
jgi:3-hydroxyisobutyrate dehydrogenase-like beta-hydroxyacid dehydrogenase